MIIRVLHFQLTLLLPLCLWAATCLGARVSHPDPLRVEIYSTPDGEPYYFLVVEKKHQRISLYRQETETSLVHSYTCATGENPGKKSASGDARTPEGIYFITEIYEDNKITVFGSRAFHLDYPNVFDQYEGRNGDGIFIHGTNKKLQPFSTNGCITLNNNDLDELAPYLTVNNLPVIIIDHLPADGSIPVTTIHQNSPGFAALMDLLSLSRDLLPVADINTLLLLQAGSQAVASINYNELDGSFLRLRYEKRAYLTPGVSSSWRILHSVHRQMPETLLLARHPSKNSNLAVVAATKHAPPTPEKKRGEALLSFVETWRQAWENKDIETYMSCYAPDFSSGKLSREGWRRKKTYLNRKYKYIRVTIRNIIVKWTKEGAHVSFQQRYESDKYQTSGTKILHLVDENGTWLIRQEIM